MQKKLNFPFFWAGLLVVISIVAPICTAMVAATHGAAWIIPVAWSGVFSLSIMGDWHRACLAVQPPSGPVHPLGLIASAGATLFSLVATALICRCVWVRIDMFLQVLFWAVACLSAVIAGAFLCWRREPRLGMVPASTDVPTQPAKVRKHESAN